MNSERFGYLAWVTLYVLLELIFHVTVINLSVNVNARHEFVRNVEIFGCFLAGVGISLFVFRMVPASFRAALTLPLLLAFCLYFCIQSMVNFLPQAMHDQAISLAKERISIVSVHPENSVVTSSRYQGEVEQKILLANIGMTEYAKTVDANSTTRMKSIYRGKSLDVSGYAGYLEHYQELSNKLVKYCKCPNEIASYNKVEASQRHLHPLGQKFSSQLGRVFIQLGNRQFTGFYFPLGFNRVDFERWLRREYETKGNAFVNAAVDVPTEKEMARAIWFTPISLGLSLFSILLNFGSAIGLMVRGVIGNVGSLFLGILTSVSLAYFGWIHNVSEMAQRHWKILEGHGITGQLWGGVQRIDCALFSTFPALLQGSL